MANWCDSTISQPTTIKVFSSDDTTHKFLGHNVTALLIDRGDIQFIPIDVGVKMRTWNTTIFLQGTSSTSLQGLVDEFYRVIHNWETSGGGTFSTADSDNMKTIDDMNFAPRRGASGDKAGNIRLLLRGFYEFVST